MIADLVALLLLGLAASLPAAVASTAYISKTSNPHQKQGTVSLLKALADQNVDRIELVGDYAAGDEFVPLQGAPFPVSRNITITSAPGSWHVLDLNFAHSVVDICATCRIDLLANLTLANARRGASPYVDFFVGTPGSVLALDGVVRHRIACTEAHDAVEALRGLRRSAILPGRDQPQQLLVEGVTYRLQRASLGLSQQLLLCCAVVSDECLETESAEVCVNKLIDEVLKQRQDRGKLSGPLLGVALAVPLAFALLLSGVLAMLVYHRKQQRIYLAAKQDSEAGGGTPGDRMTGKSPDMGWELQSSFGSPFLGAVEEPDAPIEFGEFIGAGSFGRVFRGRWGGRDVAVKVVEHNQDTAECVANEMHLLMAFNSPHVIRAYRCLSFRRLLPPAGADRNEGASTVARESTDTSAVRGALVRGLIHARSSGSLHATPNGGRRSNHSGSGQLTPRGTHTMHGSPSTGVGQGSAGSKAVPEGVAMLATWLVQEYCDSGTVKSFLARHDVPARVAVGDEQAVLLLVLLLRDTAQGLAALHSQAVVHGDLNSRNVLVATDSASEAGATAKIADLGISKAIAQHKTHRTTTNLGTITHSAPELLRSGRMSPLVDVYSRIAALQAGAAAAPALPAAAATASPVAHKTAGELLGNPSKRQLQREQQQLKLLRAVAGRRASSESRGGVFLCWAAVGRRRTRCAGCAGWGGGGGCHGLQGRQGSQAEAMCVLLLRRRPRNGSPDRSQFMRSSIVTLGCSELAGLVVPWTVDVVGRWLLSGCVDETAQSAVSGEI
ncbi:hypothetical protein COO60DRAFT_1674556 [Scenedesmus sp. NREL 46B-D3]|nr:hypothetical protein COO60DRAFT_1674556 [Scenedesmus sp. NREL 46B-D3]